MFSLEPYLSALGWFLEHCAWLGGWIVLWAEWLGVRFSPFGEILSRVVSEEWRFGLILIAALILLTRSRLRYDFVGVLTLFSCVMFGLIPAEEAFLGFAHPAVITVAAVLVLSRGLGETRMIHATGLFLRRHVRSRIGQVLSLSGITAVLSGFMNNVGALTLMMPLALRSGKHSGMAASRLLMPASFASILGGMVTLIGTPPNLILSQVRAETVGEPFRLFDFAPVGGTIALAGVVYLSLIGWRFLPKRIGEETGIERAQLQAYVTELRVSSGSRVVGRNIGEVEGSAKNALSVLAVMRREHNFIAPPGYFKILAGDLILAEASPETLSETLEQFGLEIESGEGAHLHLSEKEMLEVVVMPRSRLIGRSAATARLRQRFGINLVGLARHGETIVARVRTLPLRAGDVLLLQGPNAALEGSLDTLECLPLRSEVTTLVRTGRGLGLPLLMVIGLAVVAFGLAPVHFAFIGVVLAAVLTRQIQPGEIYDAIEWPVIIFIAVMLPVGGAFETSGASAGLVAMLLPLMDSVEPRVALIFVMIVTMLLSDVLNNTATAVLMAPVAIGIALGLGVEIDPFLMGVAIGASSTFLTPIGHQSNLIVMGPGHYRFSDYWRVGLLLDCIVLTVSWYILPAVWPL
ncbi:MAG: SLC13 family permease [Alphaproteobacteria bacterium]